MLLLELIYSYCICNGIALMKYKLKHFPFLSFFFGADNLISKIK